MTAIRKIFISYRQSDNRHFVGRIRQELVHRFGRENVVWDVDNTPVGVNMENYYRGMVNESDVVLVIFGHEWLRILRDKQSEKGKDYVQIELREAIRTKKLILPVSILGAPIPNTSDVPKALQGTLRLSAIYLRDDNSFDTEISRLVERIQQEELPLPTFSGLTSADYRQKAQASIDLGEFDKAIQEYTRALQLDPGNVELLLGRGDAQHRNHNPRTAIKDFDQVISAEPNNARAYYYRAWSYIAMRKLEKAISDFSRAIELKPDYTKAYSDRGYTYYEMGDFASAVQDFTQALATNPENASVYHLRAGAYEKLLDTEKAIADYTNAITYRPDFCDSYVSRGDLRDQQGDIIGAVADWEMALQLGTYSLPEHLERRIESAKKKLGTD